MDRSKSKVQAITEELNRMNATEKARSRPHNGLGSANSTQHTFFPQQTTPAPTSATNKKTRHETPASPVRSPPPVPEVASPSSQKYFDPLTTPKPSKEETERKSSSNEEDSVKIEDASTGAVESIKGSFLKAKRTVERFTKKTDFIEVVDFGRNTVITVGQRISTGNSAVDTLCKGCKDIRFKDCLPSAGDAGSSAVNGDKKR
ncbi:hypothetical protein BJ546DRAFT_987446 [Cryomyces antarcticus]